ncbi:Binding-protein-dependent transport systems inner membrane component [Bosea sp. LC85]|uniref:ABC transporter permease n=1 Tax=Bosea sp. LC85 TaxID=1502851 RepID=UPI0004E2A447|nr:ABC transporter permease [Bosea sp. LC85]KFC74746.1 Binding-protein-dependent transport systems inner membrane component [Bosea sp. LC85]
MTMLDLDGRLLQRRRLWRRINASVGIRLGGVLLALIFFIALFAPLLSPHDPIAQDLTRRLLPPFWHASADLAHPLGTDHLGRDYLARLLHGSQVSLGIGIGVTLLAGAIGTMLGLMAGYFGGRVDMLISFVITTRLSLPIVLVALAAVALGGASLRTLAIVLSLLLWDRFAVVVRSATQGLRNREFVQAAVSFGASHLRIMLCSLLPNLRNILIVVATLEVANVILLEAALSFLGLGARPPTPSWGLMIAEGREHILFDPWLIALPGAALCLLILAVNLLGDGVRDALDAKAS